MKAKKVNGKEDRTDPGGFLGPCGSEWLGEGRKDHLETLLSQGGGSHLLNQVGETFLGPCEVALPDAL